MAIIDNDRGSESPIESKGGGVTDVELTNLESSREVAHGGSYHDATDMRRLGKKQELRRNFRFFSILGFAVTLVSTWEGMIASSAYGLIDGGLGGTVWTFFATCIAFTIVISSMADMASMAPTSGGQYHWVSEFAPKNYQKFLSYMVGWLSALGWQAGTASVAFLAGTIIEGLIVLNHPDFVPTRWQSTLLTLAVAFIATFFNTYGARQLPTFEGIIFIIHIFGFFAIIVPLWVLSPKNSAKEVFTTFSDGGGWGSIGTACVVGQIFAIYAFMGTDSATHMSEEIKDASRIVPRVMVTTAVLNGVMGFAMIVTYCFCITDLDTALASPTGYPFIEVFYTATQSKGGATAMSCLLVVLLSCACISALATASRQLFAFARDEGLPFSRVFAKVTNATGHEIPLNAVLASTSITVVVSLLNIASTAAFNCIVSLTVGAFFTAYFISIACILTKRLRGELLPPSRWSMGRFAIPMNMLALAYILFAFIMSMFPITKQVTALDMNYSILIYGFVVIVALLTYAIQGHKIYKGPVVKIDWELTYGQSRDYHQQVSAMASK